MTRLSTIAATALLVAAAFAGNTGATSQDTASTDTCAEQPVPACNKRIVEAAFAQWQAGGSGIFETLLSPEVVWTIEGSGPSAGTLRGRDILVDTAVRPLSERLASPLRPVQHRIWADGDHVIVQWEGVATLRDGGSYRNRYAWIMRMRDGKAVEVNAFLDLPAYDAVLQRGRSQMQRRASP
ncbi:TPA: nuclear transport factor 2 family protein [Xanthomonas vasicola pv. zeae]|uniref:Ketosteroid isomerase n=3 Tax=Xanthomonas vasicola TaxID=56459 RepID=A0A836ZTJ5_XANVA|nr:nuclear transport factor 2 family protein [Xanthomonas vasicola]KFA39167.1 ketosteroid isomerase [Xanthomonas vasicola pv. musacearum NCPPB 4384]AVQ08208.1 nuclear transport factor 2 family protein [Xanthomonas vasicola pv. vasculorum]AZM72405.1 ketosteroid isomerase [Xanthomonas vasicola pv. vasculorum]AZR23967.1 nuclear transport factor 2 family protein [Xanthomonas vasicola]AZR32367.1 nuclear transport factor 2 family protein [Xanthomonas vasicola pv. musacearum NCPPB 4379]